MFDTMDQVRAACPQWFAPDTMAFWRSAIETELIDGSWFVTSEATADGTERRYTVRSVTDNDGIRTVGEFLAYASLADAVAGLERLRTIPARESAYSAGRVGEAHGQNHIGRQDTCPRCHA
jgi:hypothetical protein